MERKALEISWGSLWRVLFFVILVSIMFSGRQILLGLFLAIVISSGLEIIVDFLENRGLPRTLGVVLIFLLAILALIILVYTVIPFVIASLNTLFSTFDKTSQSAWWAPFITPQTSRSANEMINKISTQFLSGGASPLGAFSEVLGGFGLAIAVLVSSFYLSIGRDGVERFIKAVFPSDYEPMALRIYERSRRQIGSWFRTQLLLSVAMGVLVWIVLLVLGVKYSFLLGVLAGIFEIVPFVGPILSGAVAVLVALADSPALALYTLIAFLALHQLESHILVPLLTKKTIGLHPVIVIIALLIGAQVGGILGLLIAVPAAAVIQEIVEELPNRRKVYEKTS